jgi:hypothetical protein
MIKIKEILQQRNDQSACVKNLTDHKLTIEYGSRLEKALSLAYLRYSLEI